VLGSAAAGADSLANISEERVMAADAVMSTTRPVRRFYVGMTAAAMVTIFAGFAQTYYLEPFIGSVASIPAFVHMHAITFSAWLVLFLCQTSLVAADRVDIHRRLGIAGGILAAMMVVLGVSTAIYGARHGWNPGGPFPDALAFLIVPLDDIALFAGFVSAGLSNRNRPEVHKRLMMLATIGGLLWPAIVRIPFVRGVPPLMFGLILLFVVAGPIYDVRTRGRIHPVNLWGGLLILASFPIRTLIGRTDAWRSVAEWIVR
jgi:hypothetical protein